MNGPSLSSGTPPDSPELIMGLIGPVGTDLITVANLLEAKLRIMDFKTVQVHLINEIQQIQRWSSIPEAPLDTRYNRLMDAGDEFREALQMKDALALLGVSTIKKVRSKLTEKDNEPSSRTAYILRSLKTPEEVRTLRKIYGRSLLVFAAYSTKDSRRQKLAERIAESRLGTKVEEFYPAADTLIKRDEAEAERTFGQNIREAFPLADFFINTDTDVENQLTRIVELIFGNTLHTPTKDEFSMCHAWTSSMRSGALSRQVGAVIASEDGEVITVGCNEVPKAHGGQYWPAVRPEQIDARDHQLGGDRNDEMKFAVIADLLDRLKIRGWLSSTKIDKDVPTLLKEALADHQIKGLGRAEILNIGEYARLVHAEMAALMQAAFRGVSVRGATLYTTTFPCHNCAKHLIAAGISRVVYIEPYPKSYAYQFHKDSIELDVTKKNPRYVQFEAFVGVAPRCFLELFSIGEVARKLGGKVNRWKPEGSIPRLQESPLAYMYREDKVVRDFGRLLKNKGLEPVDGTLARDALGQDETKPAE